MMVGKERNRRIWVLASALLWMNMGCICPDDEDDATPRPLEEGDYVLSEGQTEGTYLDEGTYLRILSDTKVEIIYEDNGEIIVKTYEVTAEDTSIVKTFGI